VDVIESWVEGLDLRRIDAEERAEARADLVKRVVDVALASVLLVAVLPVIVLLAVVSTVSLRAWPFFVQERIGRDGRTFRFVKIRTLPPSTAAYADKYALAEVRVPTATRLMRALHLDELPQLALVVVGAMSLVGPRPEMPGLHDALPGHVARTRTLVRPGVTGLWQVGVHCDGLIGESPEYDACYVRNRSLRFDLWILAQTARKVLHGGRGHVRLDALPAWVEGQHDPRPASSVIDLTGHIATDHVELQAIDR
jgi:lipopolysaccharide/colanic/teichoic acid biosynthesis glycosyltransferase